MIKYCQDANPRFNLELFTARIDKTYNALDLHMRNSLKKVGT